MRHATSFLAFALVTLVAACAGGREAPRTPAPLDFGVRDMGPRPDGFVPGTDLGPGVDLGPAPVDMGTGPVDLGRDLGPTRRCVPTCSTDADCQASCPPNPTPSLPVCCDRGTGTCFNSSVAMCPAPMTGDAGMMMSM
jgi:hypothetical protein